MQNLLQTIMRKFYLSLQLFIGVITAENIVKKWLLLAQNKTISLGKYHEAK